jgi:SpoVK/Ycf46/Vps4 family AAA+-type ATPase
MRTHVWRRQFTRLSQRGQRLPFQRPRAFHSFTRQLEAHPTPDQETANLETAITEGATKPAASTRRGRLAQRRPKEVTPFTVPDWFLRHNVRLHAPTGDATANQESRCWTLVDRDSGHTVLTLPFTVNPSDPSNDFFTPSARPQEKDTKDSNETVSAVNEKDAVQDSVARAVETHLPPPSTLSTPDPRTLLSLQLQLLLHAAFTQNGPAAARYTKSNIDLNTKEFAHKELDTYVQQIADLVQADVIHLDANDIAELAQDYVERGDPAPGSITSLAYDTFKGARKPEIQINIIDETSRDDGQEDGESEHAHDMPEFDIGNLPMMGGSIADLADMLKGNEQFNKVLSRAHKSGAHAVVMAEMPKSNSQSSEEARSRAADISPWAELKLSTLLDTLMDSVQMRKGSPTQDVPRSFFYDAIPSTTDKTTSSPPTKDNLERFLADFLSKRVDSSTQAHKMDWSFLKESAPSQSSPPQQRTIIHVRDMDHIRNAPQGETIINLLVSAVQRRRKDGEQVVIFGTTANSSQAPSPPGQDDDEVHFRYLRYPSASSGAQNVASQLLFASHNQQELERSVAEPALQRLFEINMRHIHTMVRHLGLPVSDNFFSGDTRAHLNIPGTSKLGDRTLPQDEIQRIVLCADSLRSLYTTSPSLETSHIALAAMLVNNVDSALKPQKTNMFANTMIPQARERGEPQDESDAAKEPAPAKLDMEKLKKSCSKHETRLLSGVVDPASLRTTFNDVHADPNTIESLKTLTSLTLLRPEAFSYGVLAADRLPGLLLYGPPGTGKTLLAKAVAKESSATVLEVSGAQVYEKYVGEGEKMVNAVFSLAKKLSPCVVFIDEALFGSRGGANNRTTHREIINQFLRGWDGMDDHSVFMMVATNRPFDLDDAVLRRLPRRLLVDLPLAKDREGILNIHLKGETLDPSVSLSDLAKNTPLYSGSDLKNLCVAAALAAVRDENNLLEAARKKGDAEFKLPDRRTLSPSHFEKALQEISASVSEDMATLGAIRKFDEQYGEKRARTKKPGYGFGVGSGGAIDETGARVRPDEPSP